MLAINISNFEECICTFSTLSRCKGKVHILNMQIYAIIGEFRPFKCMGILRSLSLNDFVVIYVYLFQLLKRLYGGGVPH